LKAPTRDLALVAARRAATIAFAVVCGFSCADEPELNDAPPILMISLDTARPDHLSVYGYELQTTPNLEALAEDAVVMRNFITTSSWTLPTHASLFTGLFPSSHGAHYSSAGQVTLGDADGAPRGFDAFRANRLPDSAVTLGEILRDRGYATHGVGAGPWFKPIFGLGQGFVGYDAAFASLEGRPADEVSALGLTFLNRVGEKPFFLFMNYFDPHDPYDAHGGEWEKFLRPGDDFAISKELSHYDAEIHYADRHIGKVIAHLKDRGLYEQSWIIVTSDHGEHFGEHGLTNHGFSLYEDVVRGVLIIKPPAEASFDVDPDERCQSVDVMPTLLRALGIDGPARVEGQPLGSVTHPVIAELFRSAGNVQWKGERFSRELRAIYSGVYKLIVSTRADDPDAGLFDLASDPGELRDLSAQRSDLADSMRAELDAWVSSRSGLKHQPVDNLDPETRRQMEALGYIE
jgi:arylsulfatase A-like enzyme